MWKKKAWNNILNGHILCLEKAIKNYFLKSNPGDIHRHELKKKSFGNLDKKKLFIKERKSDSQQTF